MAEPATILHGPWTSCRTLVNAPWMAGCLCDELEAPTENSHAAALAILLALDAASRLHALRHVSVLIRSPSMVALSALQRGTSADPGLQDLVCLFTAACVSWAIPRPQFLLADDTSIDDLPSPAALARLTTDSATPRLRLVIARLAYRAQQRISLDLFASHTNTWGARYFSETREADAEGLDAFAQSSWSMSFCPHCNKARPDFVLLYPPFPLIKAALQRAQADQAHGILVVPYAASSPWWHSAMLASRTRVGPIQRAIRLPCSDSFVSNRSNPDGHFLAVLHFDFWQGPTPRLRPCPHAHLRRPLGVRTPPCDPPDRLALRQALALHFDNHH